KQPTFRSISVDGEELEFSGGFNDLHTESYKRVLTKEGFGLDDVRPSIELVSAVRTLPIRTNVGEPHDFTKRHLSAA
ncbi:MAG: oxidoreductase, partial [Pseudomonadota bacterium]